MKIHPTALIEDGAQLADDVEVGAHVLIGPEVTIGAGCKIQANAILTNKVSLGERNLVGYGTVIGSAPQDFEHDDSISSDVRIGNGNTFREYVTIHRGTKPDTTTVIGDDCYAMAGCHFAHNVQVGNKVILANNNLLAGYVTVEDFAVLGGGSVFHQFMRVGKYVMTRGGTRYNKDLPPYVTADDLKVVGLNVIGLRRAGFNPETRKEVRRAFDLIYRGNLNLTQALAQAAEQEWAPESQYFFDFIRRSKRGISRLRHTASNDEIDD